MSKKKQYLYSKTELRKLLRQWEKGKVTKADIERELGVSGARGKYITRQWVNRLGVNTFTGSTGERKVF